MSERQSVPPSERPLQRRVGTKAKVSFLPSLKVFPMPCPCNVALHRIENHYQRLKYYL
ncbi:hypothetical protein [Microseira wollei]|uniref:hypothetical protein n=1 Tax=Microseira wollei TaxID=467598 RepID=UPI001CFCD7A8|nr:hypothetical protein [Microseira wollei]